MFIKRRERFVCYVDLCLKCHIIIGFEKIPTVIFFKLLKNSSLGVMLM